MSYAQLIDVRLALDPSGPGTPESDASTAASMSDAQLQDALDQADSKINGYISARYVAPVAPADITATPLTYPAPLAFWSRDIAAYLATLTFRRGQPIDPDDPVSLRYAATMLDIRAVAAGTMNLPGVPPIGDDDGESDQYAVVINTVPDMCMGADVFASPGFPYSPQGASANPWYGWS